MILFRTIAIGIIVTSLGTPAIAHIPNHCEIQTPRLSQLMDQWRETKDDLMALTEDTPDFRLRMVEILLERNAVAQEMINELFRALSCVERD